MDTHVRMPNGRVSNGEYFDQNARSISESTAEHVAELFRMLAVGEKEHKFAVEIRNKDWLVPKLADVLREHGVALTLIDQGWMPRPCEAEVSGGRDFGMTSATATILCETCQELFDVVVSEDAMSQRQDAEVPIRCPKSSGHLCRLWTSPGPCPKCGAIIVRTKETLIWD
jgi:rubrerythrin